MSIYEHNFRRLTRLLLGLKDHKATVAMMQKRHHAVSVDVIETHKYTTVIQLSQRLPSDFPLVTFPVMKIRICYDARVAEVLSYQARSHFKPKYSYPNPQMCQIREKQRVNEFLGEWLDHCLGNRTAIPVTILQ